MRTIMLPGWRCQSRRTSKRSTLRTNDGCRVPTMEANLLDCAGDSGSERLVCGPSWYRLNRAARIGTPCPARDLRPDR